VGSAVIPTWTLIVWHRVAQAHIAEQRHCCRAPRPTNGVSDSKSDELQAEPEDHAKFVVTGTASAYLLRAMKFKPLPVGFVAPAQPVKAPEPPVGTDWVHEIKHDGYRLIVRPDGPTVRLYSRNAYDWRARLAAIAAAAEQIRARSFTIDGEAVVLGPDGLSRFEELSHREGARTEILYAFDLIEHDDEDMRNLPFLHRKAALARLLRNTEAGSLFSEHIAEDGPVVFAHACRLGAEGIVSKKIDSTYRSGPCPVWIKVRNPASIAEQRQRSEMWNR
jgi:bifunctional non-homologous end joining protein LigD